MLCLLVYYSYCVSKVCVAVKRCLSLLFEIKNEYMNSLLCVYKFFPLLVKCLSHILFYDARVKNIND